MHLLYARFWTKVMFDAGLIPFDEPFAKLRNQGMLLANTPGRPAFDDEVKEVEDDETGSEWVPLTPEERETYPSDKTIWKFVKMSKSLRNVVTPDEVADKYGADALRVYELFVAPFDQAIQWDDKGVQGAYRFLSRVWRLLTEFRPSYDMSWRVSIALAETTTEIKTLRRKTHQTLRQVQSDIEEFRFNTAVARIMEWVNVMSDFKAGNEADRAAMSEAAEYLIFTLAPIAPHLADEMLEEYDIPGFTFNYPMPKAEDALAAEEDVTIAIQVNGKLRDTIYVPIDTTDEDLQRLALASPKIITHTEGKTIRRVIVVPKKLVNIVAN